MLNRSEQLFRACSDHTFPVLAPQMPVEMAARLLPVVNSSQPGDWWTWPNVHAAARRLVEDFIQDFHMPAPNSAGRGIVIPAGGKYFVSAYVTLRVIRHVGCQLPVEIWHLYDELDDTQRRLLTTCGDVQFVDASQVARETGFSLHSSWWKGWQIKPLAIAHTRFREILLLDADSYPVRDPTPVFDWAGYRETGAVFWPDLDAGAGLLKPETVAAFGLSSFEDRPTESGQMLIDQQRCWRELNLALYLNELASYTYRQVWGDKDTFPIAWRRLGTPYSRMWPSAGSTRAAILQYDWHGRVLFQHRATDKFRLENDVKFQSTGQPQNGVRSDSSLMHERFCFDVLRELRTAWPRRASAC